VTPRRDVQGSGRMGKETLLPGSKGDRDHESPPPARLGASRALREHSPEYLIKAVGLGIIMLVSASVAFVAQTLLPVAWRPLVRRMAQGLAISGTGASLVYSPWGMRSGAHCPIGDLTLLALGRVKLVDASTWRSRSWAASPAYRSWGYCWDRCCEARRHYGS
jgi:hypothetical protein